MKTKGTIRSTAGYSVPNTLLIILCVLLILAVVSHLYSKHVVGMPSSRYVVPVPNASPASVVYPPRQMPMMFGGGNGGIWPPDVVGNPYAAPLKDDRYLVGPPMVPINVSTNPGAVDTSYRQVGVLSQGSKGGCICGKKMCNGSCNAGQSPHNDLLILMGRPLFTNRDTWQYYAISNQRNGIKLPVRVGGKNATNEYGVRELSAGDDIMVDGYNKKYTVNMYESDTIKYLPYM